MAAVLYHLKLNGRTEEIRHLSGTLYPVVLVLSQVFLSEGYRYLMDYFQVAYYPTSNRISSSAYGSRFPAVSRTTIDDLGENEAREMTGFTKKQIFLLVSHLRIPDTLRYNRVRRAFGGTESLLHYLVYNRLGVTKLQMFLFYFGGDPRRFTYSIRCVTSFLYSKFYHKISGNSMRQWVGKIHQFRSCIWKKIPGGDVQMIINSFLLLNCYNFFNGSTNALGMPPPSISKYLPLNEWLPTAPDVIENPLDDVYRHR